MRWAQSRESYRIRLGGPLGQGLLEIEGEAGRVTLRTSDERVATAETAEALLAREVGWELPVSGLRFWILGRIWTDVRVDRLELDPSGRPAELEQAGWTIRYLGYREVDGLALPSRVFLETPGLSLRVAVSDWDLGS